MEVFKNVFAPKYPRSLENVGAFNAIHFSALNIGFPIKSRANGNVENKVTLFSGANRTASRTTPKMTTGSLRLSFNTTQNLIRKFNSQ